MPSSTLYPSPSTTPFGKRVHSIVTWLMVLGLLGYAAVLGWLYYGQESLLFKPVVIPASRPLAALKTQGEGVREFTVDVPGARLSGLQLKLPNPKGVVFFLHGNGGNLDEWFINTEIYRQNNMDLVMIDYRGFGKSAGQIESEAQLHSDVRAAWDFIAPQYVGKKLVVYGRSLGSGLAAGLSAELTDDAAKGSAIVDMTVLVSPYSSMSTLTGQIYPYVPQVVLRYPLRTDQLVLKIKSPLLLIHGEQDTFIPPSHSQALKTIVKPARLLLVPGAGHNDVHKFDLYVKDFGGVLAGL